jgi:carboxymethylenebutenolidase
MPTWNHIPVLTGGVGCEELREFYSKRLIPQMLPDTEMTPIPRTIGKDQLVDEMVFKFTHTIKMAWMLPGGCGTASEWRSRSSSSYVFVGKLAHEHIYWDQASVLVQLGLLEAGGCPLQELKPSAKP